MDNPLKLDVMIAHFAYAGNGACSAEHPDIRKWEVETVLKMKADSRIGEIHEYTQADTPIPMCRNRAVSNARSKGAHLLLMVDSDQSPNKHVNEPWFKPFWDVAIDQLVDHYHKGPLVIGAPYCGPPDGTENIYVFQFENYGIRGNHETMVALEQYTRNEAARMTGVTEVAALPTGMILYDMRIFDLCEPSPFSKEQILDLLLAGQMTKGEALAALREGWFFYEWKSQYADEKASTEDVAATRELMFACLAKLGYNPLRCAWDSWIGHHKPWNVGKPAIYSVEAISAGFRNAIEQQISGYDQLTDLSARNQDLIAQVQMVPDENGGLPPAIAKVLPAAVVTAMEKLQVLDYTIFNILHNTPHTHLKALHELVAAHGTDLRIIEIGSWLGSTAIAMMSTKCVQTFHAVDNWVGPNKWISPLMDQLDPKAMQMLFESNIQKVSSDNDVDVTVWPYTSEHAASVYNDEPADIVFIDADHSYQSVRDDIYNWLPHLKPDGLMVGHDYKSKSFPGVARAVRDIFGDLAEEYAWSLEKTGFWVVHGKDICEKFGSPQDLAQGAVAHDRTN